MDKAWHKKYKTEIKKYNQDHYQTEIEALKKIIGTPLSDKFLLNLVQKSNGSWRKLANYLSYHCGKKRSFTVVSSENSTVTTQVRKTK